LSLLSKKLFSLLQLRLVIALVHPSVFRQLFSKVIIWQCGLTLGWRLHIITVPPLSPLTRQGYGDKKSTALTSEVCPFKNPIGRVCDGEKMSQISITGRVEQVGVATVANCPKNTLHGAKRGAFLLKTSEPSEPNELGGLVLF
tara:strand:- start:138 stop:566 length:429 start_codon:yes stop_codon:yes gene_type:complete